MEHVCGVDAKIKRAKTTEPASTKRDRKEKK